MAITRDFLIFGLAITFNGVLCLLVSRWYAWPALARRPRDAALVGLLWLQTCRFLNLAATTVNQVPPRLPQPWVAEIGWGDFAAAVLALVALSAVRGKSKAGPALAWLATVVGVLDLANSFGQALLLDVLDLPMGAIWYIAAVVVPILFTGHVLTIRTLLRTDAVAG